MLAVLFGLLLGSGPGRASHPAGPASPLAGWTRLRLEASKMLVAHATSVIERWPGQEGQPGVVRVRSLLEYLGNRKISDAFSARPVEGGLPARWMEIEPGRKAREVRVAPGGRQVLRRFGPPEGKRDGWTGRWTEGNTETRDLVLDGAPPACGGVIDGWALLGHLQCLTVAPEVRFRMMSNRGLHNLVAVRRGTQRVDLRLAGLDGGAERRVTVEAYEIELVPGAGEPDPSVFGMEGTVRLLVDPLSGALVRIEGRREGIPGTIRFQLTGLAATPRPRPAVPWPSEAKSAMAVPAA